MRVTSFITAVAASIAMVSSGSGAQVRDRVEPTRTESDFAPPIDLWLDEVSYDRGARMRPYFSTEPGAYVVVVRVTSDGELRVMYPTRPNQQKPYVPGQFTSDRMPYTGDPALSLHESSGTGFVFAIASYQPFDLRYFTQGKMWSTARLATFGRYGDPFEVVRKFVDRILPPTADFSLDYEVYEVYSRGTRSAYASSVGYSSLSGYHDACLTAFGIRYTYYCRAYGGVYYGPIIVNNPRPRSPRDPKIKRVRPLVHYPVVPTIPLELPPVEGRQPENNAAERAARDRYERMQRKIAPRSPDRLPIITSPRVKSEPRVDRDRAPIIYRSLPERSQPRAAPRSEPRVETRIQPRVEGRQPQRSEPRAPARVEVRNEPRPQPAGQPAPAARSRPEKDRN